VEARALEPLKAAGKRKESRQEEPWDHGGAPRSRSATRNWTGERGQVNRRKRMG
jgi:hypothetical protein